MTDIGGDKPVCRFGVKEQRPQTENGGGEAVPKLQELLDVSLAGYLANSGTPVNINCKVVLQASRK